MESRSILVPEKRAPAWGLGGTASVASAPEIHPWEAAGEQRSSLHLLVVDGDAGTRSACAEIAQRMGFEVQQVGDAAAAKAILRDRKIDLILMDLRVPSSGSTQVGPNTGLALLQELKKRHADIPFVVMTATGTVSSAVEAMRLGAEDYLAKPFALEDLVRILEYAAKRTRLNSDSRRLREKLRTQRTSGSLVGHSPEMEKLYRILSKVAHSSHPVLITGESGTGKELVARSIHFNGPSSSKPFVPVDCGLNPARLEGELFGYVKGAEPGRDGAARHGLLSMADGGTVFLDEIGDLTLESQGKLLRALQDKIVFPVGGGHSVPISGRVLASTNKDLSIMVEQGRFRRDLYFRLSVVSLRIPPLRLRKEDIPDLVQYFLDQLRRDNEMGFTVSDEVLRILMAYDWPGNVRELESALGHAAAMCTGPILYVDDLPSRLQLVRDDLQVELAERANREKMAAIAGEKIPTIAELEKNAILGTIRQLRGDKLLAAKLLGIGKTTLYRKLKEYGVQELN